MGDYTKDLKKFLRENGCTFERQGKGDHEIWYSPATAMMKIEDLIWDEAIYPRAPVSQKTVDAYVETLSIGAQFPPVRVQ
ncbi:type II toxin-antitoxin system HicA family toxin, partial [Desulfobacter latus]|uniref:type II toxin-antitoxin system HicA family toxin n=1 Tax=Desulfobacter latus TaxID=2292 RepID=UPI001C49BDC8